MLEAFNGTHFYGRTDPMPAGFAVIASTAPVTGTVTYSYVVSPPAEQVALLQQAYDALKESVYSALVVQTRLKPFLKLEGNVSNMSCSFRRRAKPPLRNINLTSGENWRALVMRTS